MLSKLRTHSYANYRGHSFGPAMKNKSPFIKLLASCNMLSTYILKILQAKQDFAVKSPATVNQKSFLIRPSEPLKLIPTTTNFNLERCTVKPLLPSNQHWIPEISLSKFP